MRKHLFCLMAVVLIVGNRPAWAQQDEIAKLRADLLAQQATIAQLLQRLAALEKNAATKDDLEDEMKAQEDAVSSVRESLLSKVNLNGYVNTRYFKDQSGAASGFALDPFALVLAKQLGRFSVFGEVSLALVPHHAALTAPSEEGDASAESGGGEGHAETAGGGAGDVSGEGQIEVRNAWLEYNQSRALNVRVGKFLSPQYFWQNHYPNVILSTDFPIHLREMFPPELMGIMVNGSVAKPSGDSELGVGYKFYVSNNEKELNFLGDVSDDKSWGGRLELRLPARGQLKTLNFAADLYRGRTALEGGQVLFDNHVWGVEQQFEAGRIMLNSEYARGESRLGGTRTGYYLQPAVRATDTWLGFYRLEGLESPRVLRAERKHLLGLNYRPMPQVTFKLEYYRTMPLERSFIHSEEERHPFNGVATAAVFFF